MTEREFCVWLLGVFEFRTVQGGSGVAVNHAAIDLIEAKLRSVLEKPKAGEPPILRPFRGAD